MRPVLASDNRQMRAKFKFRILKDAVAGRLQQRPDAIPQHIHGRVHGLLNSGLAHYPCRQQLPFKNGFFTIQFLIEHRVIDFSGKAGLSIALLQKYLPLKKRSLFMDEKHSSGHEL